MKELKLKIEEDYEEVHRNEKACKKRLMIKSIQSHMRKKSIVEVINAKK